MIVIQGKVILGKKRGKRLGFPTANVYIGSNIEEGIYISKIYVGGPSYPALTFIGAALTFGDTKVKAETYILDFEKDIYGEDVKIELLKKIRDNKKFENKKDLIDQMENDKKEAIKYFKSHNV